MRRETESLLLGGPTYREKMQSWLLSIVCVFAFAGGLYYLFLQNPEKKSFYNDLEEAVAPIVSKMSHPFDPVGKPVNAAELPTMKVWPKNSWKRVSIDDGIGGSITVMGQSALQGRVYGVDLLHDEYTKEVSPVDISLGWSRAARDESFETVRVSHGIRKALIRGGNRRWPLHQFTNTHLIPANWSVYDVLRTAKPDDRIGMAAWPVTYRVSRIAPWTSDLKYGDRNCEILLITAVRLERPDGTIRGEAGFYGHPSEAE